MIQLMTRTRREIRALLGTGAPVYLCFNPLEYHGPHLSLRNDALIGLGIAQDLHRQLVLRHPDWPLLLGGDFDLGVDPVPGPGSQPSRYQEVRDVAHRACQALAELGARRVVLMTFHGSPLHNQAIVAGMKRCAWPDLQTFAPMCVLLREMMNLDIGQFDAALVHLQDPEERLRVRDSLGFDFHAGLLETSLALHYASESVDPRFKELPPCPEVIPVPWVVDAARIAGRLGGAALAADLSFVAKGLGWYRLRPFPGYTGHPHRATAEAGALVARSIVERFAVTAEEVFAGRAQSPAPILPWMRHLTLGGRIQPTDVPEEARSYRTLDELD